MVSFINPEIAIRFAKSEASCVTLNQQNTNIYFVAAIFSNTLWQSPYESFWHIIIHFLKDCFVYESYHIHTANFQFYRALIFKNI